MTHVAHPMLREGMDRALRAWVWRAAASDLAPLIRVGAGCNPHLWTGPNARSYGAYINWTWRHCFSLQTWNKAHPEWVGDFSFPTIADNGLEEEQLRLLMASGRSRC